MSTKSADFDSMKTAASTKLAKAPKKATEKTTEKRVEKRAAAPKAEKPSLQYPSPILGIVAGTPSNIVQRTLEHHVGELKAACAENIRKAGVEATVKIAPLAHAETVARTEAKNTHSNELRAAHDAYHEAVRAAQSVRDRSLNASAMKYDAAIAGASKKFGEEAAAVEQALKSARFMLENDTLTAITDATTECDRYYADARAVELARSERLKAVAEAARKEAEAQGPLINTESVAAMNAIATKRATKKSAA